MKKLLFLGLATINIFSLFSEEAPESSLGMTPGEDILFSEGVDSSESKCCWDECAEVELSLTYSSKYVWRGLNLVNDSVLQPSVSVSKCGYSLEVWGNMDATNINGHSWEYSEIDVTFDYSNSFCWLCQEFNYSIGAINYIFPTVDDPSTWELYLGVELDTLLNPAVVVYYDVDEVKGWYATFGISHEWENIFCICKQANVGFEVAGSIGWGSSRYNEFYYSYDCSRFLDALFVLSLPTEWRCWNIKPFFAGSVLVDKDIRHKVSPNTNYWGGVTISREF